MATPRNQLTAFNKAAARIEQFLDVVQAEGRIDSFTPRRRLKHPGTLAEKTFSVRGVLYEERYANRKVKDKPPGDYTLHLRAHVNGTLSLLFKSVGQDPQQPVMAFAKTHYNPTGTIWNPIVFMSAQEGPFKARLNDIHSILRSSVETFTERVAKRQAATLKAEL